jgi:hypothetical protein
MADRMIGSNKQFSLRENKKTWQTLLYHNGVKKVFGIDFKHNENVQVDKNNIDCGWIAILCLIKDC